MIYEQGKNIGIAEQHHLPPSVKRSDLEYSRHRERKLPEMPTLGYEVRRIRNANEESLYMLPGTGFQVETQINLFAKNLSEGADLRDSFSQIEQDVQGFKTEYLTEQPLFPIVLEKSVYEGRERIVGKLYGGKPLVDATSDKEREGSVKKSVQEIEKFLLNAGPGAMAVMSSPAGWSGYEGIRYPDTQTYCFQVQKDGGIRGFTVKTNMSLSQNEELLAKYGKTIDNNKNDKERIKEVIGNVVYFEPSKEYTIEQVVEDIEEVKKTPVAYRDSAGEDRTFAEIRRLLSNPDKLWTLDERTQKILDQFKIYAVWELMARDPNILDNLKVALGFSVLRLMHEVRPPKSEYGPSGSYNGALRVAFDPRKTLNEMQKIGGCAGGGNTTTVDSITPRLGLLGGEDEYGSLQFECPECHRTNTREKGKLLSRCQYIDCQSKKVGCDDSSSSVSMEEVAVEE